MSANTLQGRVPSHNTDAEIALLGSILFKNSVLDEVQSMLDKNDFYVRGHQLIWEAMLGLRNERPNVTIDLLPLTQYMQEKKTLAEAGGAAYIAYRKFGAIMGQGVGLQGQSYGIPTMQGGVETIRPYVDEFIEFAKEHQEQTFLVTRIGCGIAGFRDEEIAPLFEKAHEVENIVLPEGW